MGLYTSALSVLSNTGIAVFIKLRSLVFTCAPVESIVDQGTRIADRLPVYHLSLRLRHGESREYGAGYSAFDKYVARTVSCK